MAFEPLSGDVLEFFTDLIGQYLAQSFLVFPKTKFVLLGVCITQFSQKSIAYCIGFIQDENH